MSEIPWRINAQIADSIELLTFRNISLEHDRFLRDVIRLSPHDLSRHKEPLLPAILHALQDITGGQHGTTLTTYHPALIFNLSHIAYFREILTDEDIAQSSRAVEISELAAYFQETIAAAIRDRTYLQFRDGGVYLGWFQIPLWFYEQSTAQQIQPES